MLGEREGEGDRERERKSVKRQIDILEFHILFNPNVFQHKALKALKYQGTNPEESPAPSKTLAKTRYLQAHPEPDPKGTVIGPEPSGHTSRE